MVTEAEVKPVELVDVGPVGAELVGAVYDGLVGHRRGGEREDDGAFRKIDVSRGVPAATTLSRSVHRNSSGLMGSSRSASHT